MTFAEAESINPEFLNDSRIARIARGVGLSVTEVKHMLDICRPLMLSKEEV